MMLVYGDPQFHAPFASLLQVLRSEIGEIWAAASSIDTVRRLLVRLGQLEQGMADAQDEGLIPISARACIEQLTDAMADLFYAACRKKPDAIGLCCSSLQQKFQETSEAWSSDVLLRIKVPEGFEFYTLYPEQYVAAAEQWLNSGCRQNMVNVVGIRSVGTTLSAVVASVLKNAGVTTRRCTVRPTGHPFQREVHIRDAELKSAAIVVDEGPGISGSSMVSVAKALVERGVLKEEIAFMPGHGKEPGVRANAETRRWWQSMPKFFVPFSKIRWSHCTHRQVLEEKSKTILQGDVVWEDLSAGAWRAAVDPSAALPSFPVFERTKYRFTAPTGQRLLWKFTGLGSWNCLSDVDSSGARSPYRIEPIESVLGFTAYPWVEGRPAVGLSDEVFSTLAHHILTSAGPTFTLSDHENAVQRLAEMAFWNTKTVFGEACAQQAVREVEFAKHCGGLPSYGDGHLGPWEWIVDEDRKFWKADSEGHTCDHTLVGRQSVLWDVAGAIVEWNLSGISRDRFLDQLAGRGLNVDERVLRFYEKAYVAFQLGKAVMCRDGAPMQDEKELERLIDRYSSVLAARCAREG